MRELTKADFNALWPQAPGNVTDGILMLQSSAFPKYGITTALRLAHLMGQISHECGAGSTTTEGLNYTPKALRGQWPSHFTPEQASHFGRTAAHPANQRMIGNLAYGGRMGNAPFPSDDGYNFRGRGLLQITGKSGYKHIGGVCGIDLANHPELIVDPKHALIVAAAEFHESKCLPHADADDVLAVSGLINCGRLAPASSINGFPSRQTWLAKWKRQLGI